MQNFEIVPDSTLRTSEPQPRRCWMGTKNPRHYTRWILAETCLEWLKLRIGSRVNDILASGSPALDVKCPILEPYLKTEISRLSRREIRKEVLPLRKIAAAHRREIAALKRTIAALDRHTKSLATAATRQPNASTPSDEKQTRFVAKGLVSLRKRLALSAADLARLLGVSMQSVYNWEHRKATPRKEQVAAIAALRSIGKKEARQRLEGSGQNNARKNARKRPSSKRAIPRRVAGTKPAKSKRRRRVK